MNMMVMMVMMNELLMMVMSNLCMMQFKTNSFVTDDAMSIVSRSDFALAHQDSHIFQESVHNPAILVGWRVSVRGYGTGLVLSVHKKKFRCTHFKIQFDDGRTRILPLQRSAKKGTVSFSLLSKIN